MSAPAPHYQVPAYIEERQRRASNPQASAWVSAHAGSGKTHVLTQRVVRLLLEGVAPDRLICLTFTKAAAANMAQRVFLTLADWTLMDDAALRAAIARTGAQPPRDLDLARRLFARAVETPGGLKIQTIHAFCERLLHLFPFEANVPADFRVVEDIERADLMAEARRRTLVDAEDDDALADAVACVAEETSDGGFSGLIEEMLRHRGLLLDEPDLLNRLPQALGLALGETQARIEQAIITGGIPVSEWSAVADALSLGSKTDVAQAALLRSAAALAPDRACLEPYCSIFLTEKGALRKTIATAAIKKSAPDLPALLLEEGARILGLCDKLVATATFARTQALHGLAQKTLRHYTEIKRTRALLDFDDLIECAKNLLLREGASSWVLFKLDGGVDHILVDEAQDTSERQWAILSALAAEFSSGASRAARARTFFAVGDEKQSIFSFQGAAPEAFGRMRSAFQKRINAAKKLFEPVQLDLSFRSAPIILAAVDAVFASDQARRGLSADPSDGPIQHNALKADMPGLVELWPPVLAQKSEPIESWALPLDLPRENDPAVILARRIAARITDLIAPDSTERIADRAPKSLRRITPGDIMILVRRRGAFFNAMVRALKEAGAPVAGADRLNVAENIAVMDLLAAARTALAPDDDLSLACVLKSPLCGLNDADLMALAPKRAGSLWQALEESDDVRHSAAAARIADWRRLAEAGRPFDFFCALLGPQGGRKAFLARLGPEAGDGLDELLALALAHERQEAPSLTAFVNTMETLDLTIKRDMEAAGGLVRVMTIHAAKGLEAGIVFLPDTAAVPTGAHDPAIFMLQTPQGQGPTLAWSPRKDKDPQAVAQQREALHIAADDEYRRLLYVALTRAEQRLYIACYCGEKGPARQSWYTLAQEALTPLCTQTPDPDDAGAVLLRMGEPLIETQAAGTDDAPAAQEGFASHDSLVSQDGFASKNGLALPDWMTRPARAEREPAPPLRPSNALAGADNIPLRDAGAAQTPDIATKPGFARQRGVLIHALLQMAPDVAPDLRQEAARRFLASNAPGFAREFGENAQEALAKEALTALALPEAAPFFSVTSRAEVTISATIARRNKTPLAILGRIDRLAEVDVVSRSLESEQEILREVWIVDFKTGDAPEETRGDYITQLALYRAGVKLLYPGQIVRAFILWTSIPRLEEVSPASLDQAIDDM